MNTTRTKNHHLESVETESDTDDNNIQYNTNEIKVGDLFAIGAS